MRTSALYDKDRSVAFYEERYSDGSHYMEEWPIEKQRRVFDVIRSLRLPLEGEAVDYGCGNGIFTDVLRQALAPGWKVYGVDVREHFYQGFFDVLATRLALSNQRVAAI